MSTIWKNFFCCLAVCFLALTFLIQPAIAEEPENKEIPLNRYGIRSTNPYLVDRFVKDGKTIDKVIVPSPPNPPKDLKRQTVVVPEPDKAAGISTISNVPALSWSFGCSATCGAMLFGYYDNTGYSNMYGGPTNSGVFPMTNATWGTAEVNGETRALCPLSATRDGLDGRAIKGHVDDYWINSTPDYSLPPRTDPYIGSWTQHTHGECTGDYMGTNQSGEGNYDGSTSFYYDPSNAPLSDFTGGSSRDGCHGLRLFAESRGYTVDANFSQYIFGYNGIQAGFTFDQFKTEIDAGRPVFIHLWGHDVLGYGYNDTGSIIYIHNTWDYSDHEMTWGGAYSEPPLAPMQHIGVTVIQLAAAPDPPAPCPPCSSNITGEIYPAGETCTCSELSNIIIGPDVTFQNGTTATFTATGSITVTGTVIVENGASATFTGPTVNVGNGFHAESGSTVTINQQP